jgi:hypothetical protein
MKLLAMGQPVELGREPGIQMPHNEVLSAGINP